MRLANHLEATGRNITKNKSVVAGLIENRGTAEDVVGVRLHAAKAFVQLPFEIFIP